MEYRVCKEDAGILILAMVQSVLTGVVASVLFYDSGFGMLACFPLFPIFYRHRKNQVIAQKRAQLKKEFRDVMQLVSGNLNAGYSLENACVQVRHTNGAQYPLMNRELIMIENGLACSGRIEDLLKDFGEKSRIAEISEFAKLIETAKQYGGNIPQLIRQMTSNFADAEMVETEIETMVCAKRLEGRIMLAIPFFIMLYFRFLNPEYVQVLYVTFAGRIWMTICLVAVFVCAAWIEKIVRIEV